MPAPACHEHPRVPRDGHGRRGRGRNSRRPAGDRGLFRERELVFSRFIAESELNRVNESAGRLVPVSLLFAETLRVALSAAAETGGMVVPTAGAALEAAGYTRDFSLARSRRRTAGRPRDDRRRLRWSLMGRLVSGSPGSEAGPERRREVAGGGRRPRAALRGRIRLGRGRPRRPRRADRCAPRRRRGLASPGRARHERKRQAAVAPRRAAAASPDRPTHRPPRRITLEPGDGVRRDVPGRRHRGEGGVSPR